MKYKLGITDHAIERVDSRLTLVAPELKDLSRFEKLIRRSGKWFLNDDGSYYCLINNLIVCVFQETEKYSLVLVTTYQYTQSLKTKLAQHCHKIEVELE